MKDFGQRLAQLPKTAGSTLVEFAAAVGVTQRIMRLLRSARRRRASSPAAADGTGHGGERGRVAGPGCARTPKKIATYRLEIEKLDPKAKRQITRLLDSFIEGQKLNQHAGQRATAREARAQ